MNPDTDIVQSATASRHGDYSASFGRLRGSVKNRAGVSLIDFVKTLEPNYRMVHYDIAWGWIALGLTLAITIGADLAGLPSFAIAVVGMVLVGYWIAYLQLFLHEGAHWNLAPRREDSDRICNTWVSWLVGIDVKRYRKIHFQHHRALGTTEDSEHTYFFPLNLAFLFKALFGVRAIEVLLGRRKFEAALSKRSQEGDSQPEAGRTNLTVNGSKRLVQRPCHPAKRPRPEPDFG